MQDPDTSRHAIVYGASGLIGWALVDELLRSYPKTDTFGKVTAVTNREITFSSSCWPDVQTPELQLCSGVDLKDGDGFALAESVKKVVQDAGTVTHIFYLGKVLI